MWFKLRTPPFIPNISNSQIDKPSKTYGKSKANKEDNEDCKIKADIDRQWLQPHDDETDDIEGQWTLHEDNNVVCVVVIEGLVEIDTDHYEEGCY